VPGGGDEIQGLKKGILEIADMIVVNKADGDMIDRARRAAGEYRAALNILAPSNPDWRPPVITISARTGTGLDEMWERIEEHRRLLTATGAYEARRRDQAVKWMHEMIDDRLKGLLGTNKQVASRMPDLERRVRVGEMTPAAATDEIMACFGKR